MIIEIKNCRNIDNCEIRIEENSLNIKYAINGIGKSTISKAISLSLDDRLNGTDTLNELTPFKALKDDEIKPFVDGTSNIGSVMVFDEEYVDGYIFTPDELLKGSFDIFICGEEYKKGIKGIEDLVEEIKVLLSKDDDIEALITDFDELSSSFGKPTKTGIHGSSPLSKAFKGGNKVINIPSGLEIYKDYIQSEENYKWIKWQLGGNLFIDVTDNCPYCVNDIKNKKATIKKVSEVYDSKSIENLNKIVAVFQRLNKYFSDETKSAIGNFIKTVDGYSDEQINYLREIRDQIDRLNEKFKNAQNIGFQSLKDIDKVIEGLETFKINPTLYNHLQSDSTIEKMSLVNDSIDNLLKKAGELQGGISRQKILIERLVKENCSEINTFLRNAGYQYNVRLEEDENGEHKLKLSHNDLSDEVTSVKTHLSFGERNAFALVLFMYDALKHKPELIILDDPISSFDKNKKYAIVDLLFRKEKCFKGKTVLLLTHDFEPIVDMVYHHTDRFEKPFVVFLENLHGALIEKEIQKENIKPFVAINEENIASNTHILNKIVYLRRLFEVANEKGMAYQIISSLLHKMEKPNVRESGLLREMTSEELAEGTSEIIDRIPEFDYESVLATIKDDQALIKLYHSVESNYEKLHIYRVIFNDKQDMIESDIIQKFINEAFHIENDYIYQLNPSKYQTVPQYVIDECDQFITRLHENTS